MTTEEVKQFLLTHKKPSYLTTDKKELRVRCPYCGDSKSHKDHAHLYIQMKPPFKFYCQKCNTSGVLCHDTLRDLQLYDSNLNLSIITLNKSIKKPYGSYKKVGGELKNILYGDEIENKNRQYIEKRFGISMEPEELANKCKVVLNPPKFLRDNGIDIPWQYDFNNAVGFISTGNSFIVFRDTSGQQKKRYYNLNLFPDEEISGGKIYNIRNELDIMKKQELIITEGIFDIIGVYNHIYEKNDKDRIFAAACGKGFSSVISHYVHKGFFNIDITIFSDADVKPEFYQNLKRESPYIEKLTVYYNKKSKDFGVTKNEIELRKMVF